MGRHAKLRVLQGDGQLWPLAHRAETAQREQEEDD